MSEPLTPARQLHLIIESVVLSLDDGRKAAEARAGAAESALATLQAKWDASYEDMVAEREGLIRDLAALQAKIKDAPRAWVGIHGDSEEVLEFMKSDAEEKLLEIAEYWGDAPEVADVLHEVALVPIEEATCFHGETDCAVCDPQDTAVPIEEEPR